MEEALGAPLAPGDVVWDHWVEEGTDLLVARMRLAVLEHDEPVAFEGVGETQQEAERGAAEAALVHLEAWLLEQIWEAGLGDGVAAAGRAEHPADEAEAGGKLYASEVLPIAEAVRVASKASGGNRLNIFLQAILGSNVAHGDIFGDFSEDGKIYVLRLKVLEVEGGPLEFTGEGADNRSSVIAASTRACDALPAYLMRLSSEGQHEIARRGQERGELRGEMTAFEELVRAKLGAPTLPKGTVRYTFPGDGTCVVQLDLLGQGATLVEFVGRGPSEVSSMRAAIGAAADGLQEQLESLPPEVQQDIARRGRDCREVQQAKGDFEKLLRAKLGVPNFPKGTVRYTFPSDGTCVVELGLLGKGATLEFVGRGSSEVSSMRAAIAAAADGLQAQLEALPPEVQQAISQRFPNSSMPPSIKSGSPALAAERLPRAAPRAEADPQARLRGLMEEALGAPLGPGDVAWDYQVEEGTDLLVARMRLVVLEHDEPVAFEGVGETQQEAERGAAEAALGHLEAWLLEQIQEAGLSDGVARSGRAERLADESEAQGNLPAAEPSATILPIAESGRSEQAAERPGAEAPEAADRLETEAKQLVSLMIGIGQSRSQEWARTWRQYCDSKGGGAPVYDPDKHDFRFLEGFYDHIQLPAANFTAVPAQY